MKERSSSYPYEVYLVEERSVASAMAVRVVNLRVVVSWLGFTWPFCPRRVADTLVMASKRGRFRVMVVMRIISRLISLLSIDRTSSLCLDCLLGHSIHTSQIW